MKDLTKIPGYEDYLISKCGVIFSTKSNRNLATTKNSRGYLTVCFCYNRQQKRFLVHRLLAFVFLNLPSLDSPLEVDHIDGNKLNNSLENLQVVTRDFHNLKTLSDIDRVDRTLDKICPKCGKEKHYRVSLCTTCRNLLKPTLDIIQATMLEEKSWKLAGLKLNMSESGLRKRYITLGGDINELYRMIKK